MSPGAEVDVVVVGGGPAGLSAARTAAGLGLCTLLLEELPGPGILGHPCGGVLAPVPGFVSGRRQDGSLRFPEVDLTVPREIVLGFPAVLRYVSPGGHEVRGTFPVREDFPIAMVDKAALLTRLSQEAQAAGAELRFDAPVVGLLEEGGRVAGVLTRREEVRARIVLSAEGVAREVCEKAGLYGPAPGRARYAFVVSEELDAPAARQEDVGQTTTFGRRYTSAPRAVGAVLVPRAGRLYAYFSVTSDEPIAKSEASLWSYLEEYKREDPRVRHLFVGATSRARLGCRMVVRETPASVVRDGFMGLGDATTPGGHLGILPSMYMGRHAARMAAEALRAGDVSADRLAPYDRLFHGPFLRGLETESRIIMALTGMRDEEIDRVCQTLGRMNLAPFFFGDPVPLAAEALRWFARALPLILRDGHLLLRVAEGA